MLPENASSFLLIQQAIMIYPFLISYFSPSSTKKSPVEENDSKESLDYIRKAQVTGSFFIVYLLCCGVGSSHRLRVGELFLKPVADEQKQPSMFERSLFSAGYHQNIIGKCIIQRWTPSNIARSNVTPFCIVSGSL